MACKDRVLLALKPSRTWSICQYSVHNALLDNQIDFSFSDKLHFNEQENQWLGWTWSTFSQPWQYGNKDNVGEFVLSTDYLINRNTILFTFPLLSHRQDFKKLQSHWRASRLSCRIPISKNLVSMLTDILHPTTTLIDREKSIIFFSCALVPLDENLISCWWQWHLISCRIFVQRSQLQ